MKTETTDKNLGTALKTCGEQLSKLSLIPAAHWLSTEQPKVNLFKEAVAQGNLRYFSSRAAVGLFFVGALTQIAGNTINAYRGIDESDDNLNSGTKRLGK